MEKTTDLPQVTDKLYHIMLYRIHNVSGDMHRSCKSNYYMITTVGRYTDEFFILYS